MLDQDLARLLNEEIARERYASASYAAIACWADNNAYPGLTAWGDANADEEWGHAKGFMGYLRDRDQVTLGPLPEPVTEFTGYANCLECALALERTVTGALNEILKIAHNLNDGGTIDFLLPYLKEQVEAENNLEIYLLRLSRGAPVDLLDAILFEG